MEWISHRSCNIKKFLHDSIRRNHLSNLNCVPKSLCNLMCHKNIIFELFVKITWELEWFISHRSEEFHRRIFELSTNKIGWNLISESTTIQTCFWSSLGDRNFSASAPHYQPYTYVERINIYIYIFSNKYIYITVQNTKHYFAVNNIQRSSCEWLYKQPGNSIRKCACNKS